MQHNKVFDASITLSCKPKIGGEILAAFKDRSTCKNMFHNSCFGWWLDNPKVDVDPLLLHYMISHEVITDPRSEVEKMVFKIGSYGLSFGKKEFWLVTSFCFGYYFPTTGSSVAFRSRVIPMVARNVSVKLDDVMNVFNHSLNDLSDKDAVHVCLLYMLEKGFNGGWLNSLFL